MGVIQSTLGTQVWDLNMMDFTSYEGQWCTAVEITIPEFSASNCHLVASQDVEAIAAAQNENKSQVKQSLTQALQGLKPNVVIDRADHRAENLYGLLCSKQEQALPGFYVLVRLPSC